MSFHANFAMMRTMTQDQSLKNQKLKAGTFKRILTFAKPYKAWLTIFLLTVVIDAVLMIASPLLLKKLIDQGVVPKDGAVVTKLALIVGLVAVGDAVFTLLGRWYSSQIGEGLIYDLRSQVFAHIQTQSIAFFTRTQTGALISRINSDVIGAQQAFTGTLSGLVSNSLSLVLVTGAMLTLSWQITVLSLFLLPLFLYPTKWVGRKIQAFTRESFNLNAEMSSTMTERFNVSGALLVSLYGDRNKERINFSTKARRVADIGIRIALLNRVFFVGMTSVAAVATAIAFGVGGHLAISGSITVGTLLAITALLARLYGPLTALSNDDALRAAVVNRHFPTIITPHEGEFARFSNADLALNRMGAAFELARDLNVVVVLKGSGTIVVSPDGILFIDVLGTPALATAGSGDVLSGLMGALLAGAVGRSGVDIDDTTAAEVAAAAVWLHSEAGRIASIGGSPVSATQILAALPAAVAAVRQPGRMGS